MPSRKIASSVIVEAARPNTTAVAHHESTGICAASSVRDSERIAASSLSTRVKLWITGTLPSTSEARSARLVL